ncbi:MAG: dihydrolipoamide acetyltransferase family protein [Acidimicrobiales bacterium]
MADVLMPRLSDTMEEGTVARWLKHPGDPVKKGDVLAEIETDKATMDLEAYEEGVLQEILVGEGATVAIGQRIAVIGAGAAPFAPRPSSAPGLPSETEGRPPAPPASAGPGQAPSSTKAPLGPPTPKSSPLARSLARRHGLDLANITGSGPGGRVVRADVEAAVARQAKQPKAAAAPAPLTAGATAAPSEPTGTGVSEPDEVEEVPLSNLRRLTAQRLSESAQAPHFYLTIAVDAEPLLNFRSEVNRALPEGANRVTVTDILVKACAGVLREHPEVRSSWAGDRLLRHRRVNVGLAVAVPDGLVVPVVHDADHKTLRQVATEARALAQRAREGKLSLDDLAGGTFTISNLGMYGIDHFTAIINPPQAAILAVGAATEEPVARDGQVVVGKTMKLTLSIDHRVLDGATAAGFLTDLRQVLQDPLRSVI